MILSVQHLTKSFKDKKVLDDLSLTISTPGIWALIAPNGSGKTTLMDCIAHLQSWDTGKITLLGKNNADPSVFLEFSYLQDNRILYPELSGLEHLQFLQKCQGLPKEAIQEAIAETHIEDYVKSPVKRYSLGMKQHLLLAMSILNQPKLLLLDEPLNGLDPTSHIETRQLLQKMAQKGCAIIVSSHQLNEVDQLTDQFLFLKNGKIIEHTGKSNQQVYKLTTANDALVYQLLKEQIPLSLEDDASLKIISQEDEFDSYLRSVMNLHIPILSIEKQENHSEHLYQEIFGT